MSLILPLAAIVIGGGGLLSVLLQIVILCIVIWAVYALLQWAGVTIPRPLQILFTAIFLIIVIIWLFQLIGAA